jgi:hypothetical protein
MNQDGATRSAPRSRARLHEERKTQPFGEIIVPVKALLPG